MLPTYALLTLLGLGQTSADEGSLQAMLRRVQGAKVSVVDVDRSAVQLVPTPLVRYSDELRRIRDAGIWIWTTHGRPVAAMKVEHYQAGVLPRPWLYCFASLTSDLVIANWHSDPAFRASKPGVSWQSLSEEPAATRSARSIQLRDLARRFSAEILRIETTDERHQMRLLSRPLYRYPEDSEQAADGALFGFTGTGTNPDLLLLLEMTPPSATTKSTWQFGLVGMTAEGLTVRFENGVVWKHPYTAGKRQVFDTWTYFIPVE